MSRHTAGLVVHHNCGGGQSVDPIYPIIAPRRLNSDRVLASGLRRREAFRMAERLSRTPNPQREGR